VGGPSTPAILTSELKLGGKRGDEVLSYREDNSSRGRSDGEKTEGDFF
jgi:hypothetical protein